jgi:two-component system response regulator
MIEDATILIADDNPEDAQLLRRAFHEAGLENPICYVNDGYAAIEYLKEKERPSPDSSWPLLMFLELKMSGCTGFAVLDWLRHQPDLHQLPTIVFTHSDAPDDIEKSFQLGANSYWVKPSRLEDLVPMIGKLKNMLGQVMRKVDCDLPVPAPGW